MHAHVDARFTNCTGPTAHRTPALGEELLTRARHPGLGDGNRSAVHQVPARVVRSKGGYCVSSGAHRVLPLLLGRPARIRRGSGKATHSSTQATRWKWE